MNFLGQPCVLATVAQLALSKTRIEGLARAISLILGCRKAFVAECENSSASSILPRRLSRVELGRWHCAHFAIL